MQPPVHSVASISDILMTCFFITYLLNLYVYIRYQLTLVVYFTYLLLVLLNYVYLHLSRFFILNVQFILNSLSTILLAFEQVFNPETWCFTNVQ